MSKSTTLKDVLRVREWAADAIADGWKAEVLYKLEQEDQSTRLEKDGFVAHIISREPHPRTKHLGEQRYYEAGIAIWGPDRLAIEPPETYNWQAIVDGLRVCQECKRIGETVQIGFAGRVCPTCREILKPKIEYPGWYN